MVFECLCRPGADGRVKSVNVTFHYMLHFIPLKAREGEVKTSVMKGSIICPDEEPSKGTMEGTKVYFLHCLGALY